MRVQTILYCVISLFMISLLACEDSPKSGAIFPTAKQHYLTNEQIRILLPKDFKRSSRFRLNQDMPILNQDSLRLRYIEDELSTLEFEDRDIDVFVDTTLDYRFIVIVNLEKISFNRSDIAILRSSLNKKNEETAYNNPSLSIGETKATINNNATLTIARLTTPVIHLFYNTQTYNTTYFVSSKSNTIAVYEFSESEKRVEKYLWACEM